MVKEYSIFFCLDDNHRVKVGKPGLPVVAAERGRQVLTASGVQFQVGDHGFTKFSIIPSVFQKLDIPDDFDGSWYSGNVSVVLKEVALEPSSPAKHVAELHSISKLEACSKSIFFLYTDGGPDHY